MKGLTCRSMKKEMIYRLFLLEADKKKGKLFLKGRWILFVVVFVSREIYVYI